MCVKDNFNNILNTVDTSKINEFMDNCETCIKYGSCDYLGYLDNRLIELETVVGE